MKGENKILFANYKVLYIYSKPQKLHTQKKTVRTYNNFNKFAIYKIYLKYLPKIEIAFITPRI